MRRLSRDSLTRQAKHAMDIIKKTEEFVKEELKNNDASHDWAHIERVRNIANKLSEKKIVDRELVELGALLHEVGDWKYGGSKTKAKEFLIEQKLDPERAETVLKIVEGVSFKNELGGGPLDTFPELEIVQDADRLDAIGAIGIARTFTYSGAKKRPMYNPDQDCRKKLKTITQEEYVNRDAKDNSTVSHFYEKLLHLKDMMKTEEGRQMAEDRHQFTVSFLDQFFAEWDAKK